MVSRHRRTNPLGQAIADTMADLRERVEVDWHHDRWHVTAGSFESALEYVAARFPDAAVLARHDHGRRWPRVTLVVTTDPTLAATAPPLAALARPPEPEPRPEPRPEPGPAPRVPEPRREVVELPSVLEEIFLHQNDGR